MQGQVLFQHHFKALGGVNEILLYSADQATADNIFLLLENQVLEIEGAYSRYKPESIVSKINASAGKETVELDEESAALIDYADTLYQESDGLFDITSGILRRIWDFDKKIVPTQAEIDKLLPKVGWQYVDWKSPFIKLTKPEMQIDFGGFGKEYAVDRARSLAIQIGVRSALINLSGDVAAVGPRPDGSPWSVGITHPREKGEVIASFPLRGGGVATSGDYERYFEKDGKRYSHILNPKTGMPVESFQSVTVMAESCLVAGSLTTVAMLLGEEKGLALLNKSGAPYIIVDSSGKLSKGGKKLSL